MCLPNLLSVHQLRIVLQGVSLLVWRRLLVPGNIPLADLHQVLPTAFGWSNFYLYEFHFHGRIVGRGSGDPHAVRLADLALHRGGHFHYRYSFFTAWECDIRLEALLAVTASPLPFCVAGRNPAPEEEAGGAWQYQRLQDHYRFPPTEAVSVLAGAIRSAQQRGDRAKIDLEEPEQAQQRVNS
jgi:Plasmid pRiA4b ORF-3-like protein